MFVPDLLHEIELGVFQSIFTHLICVLYAQAKDNVAILDARYAVKLNCPQSNLPQISTSSYFWTHDYSTISSKCLRNEENGSARL